MLLGNRTYILMKLRECVRNAIMRFWAVLPGSAQEQFIDSVMEAMTDAPLLGIIEERSYATPEDIKGRQSYATVATQMTEEYSCALMAVRPDSYWSPKRAKRLKALIQSEFERFDRGRRYGTADDNSKG